MAIVFPQSFESIMQSLKTEGKKSTGKLFFQINCEVNKCLALFLFAPRRFSLWWSWTAGWREEDMKGEKVEMSERCWSNIRFDDRFPVEVRGPVDQVEGAEEDGEHYPGHFVDLADAVVGLFGVQRRLGFSALHLNRGAV